MAGRRRPRRMSDKDFRQWERLPHYVVWKHFSWAFNGRSEGLRRHWRGVLYDDLVAEGNMALIEAWSRYDSTRRAAASFKTYAYRAIYNRVAHYIETNVSPLTMKEWRKAVAIHEDEVKPDVQRAINCLLFSEIEARKEGNEPGHSFQNTLEDRDSSDESQRSEDAEWTAACIEKLRCQLGKRKTRLLLRRAAGESLDEIGKRLGVTREWARQFLNEWMIKASAILAKDEDDGFDK